MPVQINIGLNKKVGEANYGSRGACVNLEVELDSGVVDDPDRLRSQIQKLFGLARKSLDAELEAGSNSGNGYPNGQHHNGGSASGNSATGNGNSGNGNSGEHGGNGHRQPNGRSSTQSQVRAIKAIAGRNRIDLGPLLDRYSVRSLEDLSISEASSVIDELKGQPAGNGGGR